VQGRWSRFWGMATVGLLLGAAAAHAADPSRSPRGAGGLQPVTVQLNWRHQFEFAAFYAAEVRGGSGYRDASFDDGAFSLIPGYRKVYERTAKGIFDPAVVSIGIQPTRT